MRTDERAGSFRWDLPTGLIALVAATLCLVPLVGFLLAWHMRVDLADFTLFATVPALVGLGFCEYFLVQKSPLLFNRFAAGLLGGLIATLAYDLVRYPGAYVLKGAPDYVPLIGQHLVGETIGIAPTPGAVVIGYAYHYLLIGALSGAAYSLTLGKGRWYWGLGTGLALALGFLALPQAQLLIAARGFSFAPAAMIALLAFGIGGAVLGGIVQILGRTLTNALYVVFLREEPVETPARVPVGRL